mmetsp:Transcript_6294/g.13125  ORF Transcript_6294/g.13125 Transcript_6294/m.13125 type:complete len:186 (-) Transcript_6294:30-587(-)
MEPSAQYRKVSFSSKVFVYLVPSTADLTQEEIESSWLTESDLSRMADDVVASIIAMRKQKSHSMESYEGDGNQLSFRGLEHLRSRVHNDRQQKHKDLVYNTVLSKQKRDDQGIITNHDEIALVSNTLSGDAVRIARDRAISDEAFVIHSLLKIPEVGSKEGACCRNSSKKAAICKESSCTNRLIR